MVIRSDIQQQAGEIARAKAAAKECLIAADKFLKDKQFDKARTQVDKAKVIDPANPYISAFEERIKIFETQIKSQPPPPPPPPPEPESTSAPAPASTPAPKPPTAPSAKPASVTAPSAPKPAEATVPSPKPVVTAPPPTKHVPPTPVIDPPKSTASGTHVPDNELKSKMDEMSKQILELSKALVSERKTREDVQKRQLEQSVMQFKEALQKAWALGAPKDDKIEELQTIGRSLGLDDDMLVSNTREVKLEMYGRAVKQMLAKRKLVRSSSSTMDWLRKVYQVSMSEYLEYESRFLLDLVTDQFRGSMLLVSANDAIRREIGTKMRSSGFAVVNAMTAEEALEKIERVSPTVIVTETQFPGRAVSGVMFLQLLRANPKFSYVPVILVCDEQEAVTLASSELREIEGIVKKPIDFDEMSATINEKLALLRQRLSNL